MALKASVAATSAANSSLNWPWVPKRPLPLTSTSSITVISRSSSKIFT